MSGEQSLVAIRDLYSDLNGWHIDGRARKVYYAVRFASGLIGVASGLTGIGEADVGMLAPSFSESKTWSYLLHQILNAYYCYRPSRQVYFRYRRLWYTSRGGGGY